MVMTPVNGTAAEPLQPTRATREDWTAPGRNAPSRRGPMPRAWPPTLACPAPGARRSTEPLAAQQAALGSRRARARVRRAATREDDRRPGHLAHRAPVARAPATGAGSSRPCACDSPRCRSLAEWMPWIAPAARRRHRGADVRRPPGPPGRPRHLPALPAPLVRHEPEPHARIHPGPLPNRRAGRTSTALAAGDAVRCPRCRSRLRVAHDMQHHPLLYWRCPEGHLAALGRRRWTFLREKDFIRPAGRPRRSRRCAGACRR